MKRIKIILSYTHLCLEQGASMYYSKVRENIKEKIHQKMNLIIF